MDYIDLKQICGAKHFISTEIGHNSMKGHNSGDARIKIRINKGDSYDKVFKNL
jgi:translation initiation factor IF-1